MYATSQSIVVVITVAVPLLLASGAMYVEAVCCLKWVGGHSGLNGFVLVQPPLQLVCRHTAVPACELLCAHYLRGEVAVAVDEQSGREAGGVVGNGLCRHDVDELGVRKAGRERGGEQSGQLRACGLQAGCEVRHDCVLAGGGGDFTHKVRAAYFRQPAEHGSGRNG